MDNTHKTLSKESDKELTGFDTICAAPSQVLSTLVFKAPSSEFLIHKLSLADRVAIERRDFSSSNT